MSHEVRVSDHALEGREAWFHVHHSQLRFGPIKYNLVSGLRFGSSSFNPNAKLQVVPQRSVFHRLFQGRRTTVTQLEERFRKKTMIRDVADYLKVANILFVYRMIMCLDHKRVVDPWVWALVEDDERWNAFPWGAYSYQMLMHFISILPCRREAMGGKGDGQYHFYGPIWALQIWACEVIPDLARVIAAHTGQLMLPRALSWTDIHPTVDARTLLHGSLGVVSFVPSPEEMVTPYYRSMQLEAGARSVIFVPPRSGNKKKMIANAATCCSSAIVDVVGPSARGTRVARTPQKRRTLTRGLREEPDPDYIPDLQPPTEEAAEHTADSDHRASPHRAWGIKRSRRDRPLSSEEPSVSFLQRVVDVVMPHVQEYVDRTIAQALAGLNSRPRRSPTPKMGHHNGSVAHPTCPECSRGHSTFPDGSITDSTAESLQTLYCFRTLGPRTNVLMLVNSMPVFQSWFDELEDPKAKIREMMLSYFLTATVDESRETASVGQCWLLLGYMRPSSKSRRSFIFLTLIAYGHMRMMTTDGGHLHPDLYIGSRAIVVCNILKQHWVVVRVHLIDWVVESYDSFLFHMDDLSNPALYLRRDKELMPLLRLLPRLLQCAGFWADRHMSPRCAFAMTLDKSIADQYMQTDSANCGVYTCIYVDRLLGGGPDLSLSEHEVHAYRNVIESRIYSLIMELGLAFEHVTLRICVLLRGISSDVEFRSIPPIGTWVVHTRLLCSGPWHLVQNCLHALDEASNGARALDIDGRPVRRLIFGANTTRDLYASDIIH
ncbi:hypothetical protein C2S51_005709 [Perilla frutescens var. frutescens]|nr:hypothetical protein C2S51_005709 [Perilla frutescens var. frutescens]